MSSIERRKYADGRVVYDARIKIKKAKDSYYRESKTFSKRTLAQAWIKKREREVEMQLALEDGVATKTTWKEAAAHHLEYLESQDQLKRTKRTTIEFLMKRPFADLILAEIKAKDILKHLRERIIEDGAKPQTVNNDLAYIGSVMRHAVALLDEKADLNELQSAKEQARSNNLVCRPNKRDRRISKDEETAILNYFKNFKKQEWVSDIISFALASARRQSEITRLRWDDLNREKNTIIVRDLKHPRLRGYTKKSKLTAKALQIIERQPKTSEFIFPYNPKTVGAYFTTACKILEIKGLRFHDLRHEATSRLFESGYSIVEVQMFTLHESWSVLKRYTHLDPDDIEIRED